MKKMTLMNPGPVNVTDWVRDAQLRGDLCHREPEFSDLMWSIRKKLLQAFDIEEEYSAILITGSELQPWKWQFHHVLLLTDRCW